MENTFRVIVYIGSFVCCFTVLSWVDFGKFMRQGKTNYGQLLLFIFAMALAYLVAEFLLGLQL